MRLDVRIRHWWISLAAGRISVDTSQQAMQRWASKSAMEFGSGWKADWAERIPDDAANSVAFRLVLEKGDVSIQNEITLSGNMLDRRDAFNLRMEAKRRLLAQAAAQIPFRRAL